MNKAYAIYVLWAEFITQMISKSYTPTVASRYMATRQLFHKTKFSRFFYAFFIGLPVLLFIIDVVKTNSLMQPFFNNLPDWATILVTLSCPFIFFPTLQYARVRRTCKSMPSARGEHTFEFNVQSMKNTGPGFSLDIAWQNIRKIDLSRDFLLLFLSSSRAYCVPRVLLSSDEICQIRQWHAASHAVAGGTDNAG